MNPPPDELDRLFATARSLSAADHAGAERAVKRWRAGRARRRLGTWAASALASAAMLGGALYLQTNVLPPHRTADLPTSAAYDAYQAWSDGW